MTLPDEEINALINARKLLVSLLHPSYNYYEMKWKRVPRALRIEARNVLRHYPYQAVIMDCWKKRLK